MGYRINKFVQDLYKVPGLRREHAADPGAVFDRYGLTDRERAALLSPSTAELCAVGMHSMLQIPFIVLVDSSLVELVDASDYFEY